MAIPALVVAGPDPGSGPDLPFGARRLTAARPRTSARRPAAADLRGPSWTWSLSPSPSSRSGRSTWRSISWSAYERLRRDLPRHLGGDPAVPRVRDAARGAVV